LIFFIEKQVFSFRQIGCMYLFTKVCVPHHQFLTVNIYIIKAYLMKVIPETCCVH